MHNCIEGMGVSDPNFCATSWSSDVPAFRSDPCVCRGCDWVRNTAAERK